MLLFRLHVNWKKKIREAILFGFISTLPAFLWVYKTYMISGTLTGPRNPSSLGVITPFMALTNEFSSWFIPSWRLKGTGSAVFLLVLLSVGLTVLFLAWRKVDEDRSSSDFDFFSAHALFVFLYCAFLVWSAASVAFDPISRSEEHTSELQSH